MMMSGSTKRPLWAGSVAAVVVGCLAYWAGAADNGKKPGPPPLKLDLGAPLLLDAPKKKTEVKPDDRIVADNESCYVCHGNYREEEMVLQHARANVGCVKCHGASLAHRDDEDNITPPDIIFGRKTIDKGCKTCHDEHDVAAKKVVAKWQERCPGKKAEDLVCTDCHGKHRLERRTVRWDKDTRALITGKEKK